MFALGWGKAAAQIESRVGPTKIRDLDAARQP
jgi:hypothetical protein